MSTTAAEMSASKQNTDNKLSRVISSKVEDNAEITISDSDPRIAADEIPPKLSATKLETVETDGPVLVISHGNIKSTKRSSKISLTNEYLDEFRPIRSKSRGGIVQYTKSDSSIYPSYTNLTLPYRVICRQRYQNAIRKHHQQFIKEIRLHERLQPYALGGIRLRREFCNPILKRVGNKDLIKLTIDQERRLEFILKSDPHDL